MTSTGTTKVVTSPPPPPTVGIQAADTKVTEPTNAGASTTATFQVYRGGGASLTAPEIVNWQVVAPDSTYVGTSSFANGLPSGSVTIAAGQSTGSFNVVIPNGIGTVPEATHLYWVVRLVTSHVVFLAWSYPLWRKVFRVAPSAAPS